MKFSVFMNSLVVAGCLSSAGIQESSAKTLDVDVIVLDRQNLSGNPDWRPIDLSSYRAWEFGIRSLYIEMYLNLKNCAFDGDTVGLELRPMGNEAGKRFLFLSYKRTDGLDDWGVSYVWVALNDTNRLEYRITGNDTCPAMDVRFTVKGYE